VNPDTGAVVWVTDTRPGGTAGGLQWGSGPRAVELRERRVVPLRRGDLQRAAYWGSGYTNLGGTPNNKLFAFGLN